MVRLPGLGLENLNFSGATWDLFDDASEGDLHVVKSRPPHTEGSAPLGFITLLKTSAL